MFYFAHEFWNDENDKKFSNKYRSRYYISSVFRENPLDFFHWVVKGERSTWGRLVKRRKVQLYYFRQNDENANSAKNHINLDRSRYSNSNFTVTFGFASPIKVWISKFLLTKYYNKTLLGFFCSVGILILGKCQKVLTSSTYLEIRIHTSSTLLAPTLLQRSQSQFFNRRKTF